jgi:hypothetical protein
LKFFKNFEIFQKFWNFSKNLRKFFENFEFFCKLSWAELCWATELSYWAELLNWTELLSWATKLRWTELIISYLISLKPLLFENIAHV